MKTVKFPMANTNYFLHSNNTLTIHKIQHQRLETAKPQQHSTNLNLNKTTTPKTAAFPITKPWFKAITETTWSTQLANYQKQQKHKPSFDATDQPLAKATIFRTTSRPQKKKKSTKNSEAIMEAARGLLLVLRPLEPVEVEPPRPLPRRRAANLRQEPLGVSAGVGHSPPPE